MRCAPRPGYQLASLHYRLGLPIPRGRLIFVGGHFEYRQMRRNLVARRRRRLGLYEARRAAR
jgi:hypothetical protein